MRKMLTLSIKANQNMPNPSIDLDNGGLGPCERAINNFDPLSDLWLYHPFILLRSTTQYH